jgi:tRNA 2-thiocytidine biosynthesis protein TtcA
MNRAKQEALYGGQVGWELHKLVGRALEEFQLLQEGDHVLVAVSGGKDSLTMLDQLCKWQGRLPLKYRLSAAHVKTDFHCAGCMHQTILTDFFGARGVPGHFLHADVLAKLDGREMSCFHCARQRRTALFKLAGEIGANKVALGHHLDDLVETTLMNMFFNGNFSTMVPNRALFHGALTVIRPLAFVPESLVRTYVEEQGFPRQMCRCPYGRNSMRAKVKAMIKDLEQVYPDVRNSVFSAMRNIKEEYVI